MHCSSERTTHCEPYNEHRHFITLFEFEFPVPRFSSFTLLNQFLKIPPKIMDPSLGGSPLHSENGRRGPGAKQNAQGRYRNLTNLKIKLARLKLSQPQNETL